MRKSERLTASLREQTKSYCASAGSTIVSPEIRVLMTGALPMWQQQKPKLAL